MPELTALLPPEAPPQARPFSLGGLHGQQARATVYIEEILLPHVQDGLHPRPKSVEYHATYRLVLASSFKDSFADGAAGCAEHSDSVSAICLRTCACKIQVCIVLHSMSVKSLLVMPVVCVPEELLLHAAVKLGADCA